MSNKIYLMMVLASVLSFITAAQDKQTTKIPELNIEKKDWVNCEPLKLADFKGKVIHLEFRCLD